MLVLSRKVGEKIVINGGIVITVVKIDRNQTRIGIEAPEDISVYREELLLNGKTLPEPEAADVDKVFNLARS